MRILKKKKPALQVGEVKRRTKAQEIWRQFRKNKGAMIALYMLFILVAVLVFAQFYYDYETDICAIGTDVLAAPSWEHPMGTDRLGRDVMARILYGGRWSLSLAIISVILSVGLGTVYGAIATYIGGKVETIMMRIADALMMIPSILLVIALVSVLGTTTVNLVISISFGGIPFSARLARSVIMPVRDADYVEAARSIGASDARILFGHILPNCLSPIIVSFTMRIGTSILSIATYGFLGLGVPLPIPEWGSMLNDARGLMGVRPDLIVYPGVMILICVLIFNMVGDGLRDALDPKLKR